jgi:NADH-quinone oxidoreductase subunit M
MLKMGLYIIRWQLPIAPLAAKEYMYIFISLGIAGVIWFHSLRIKDLKVSLLLISPRWVNCSGTYTLTIDGLRGAVLQMIAHGFVVGLFSSLTFFRRYETRTIAEMGIRTQSPRFASMFLLLVLASVALPTTFNFVGEFTVLYSLSQINVWFAFLEE